MIIELTKTELHVMNTALVNFIKYEGYRISCKKNPAGDCTGFKNMASAQNQLARLNPEQYSKADTVLHETLNKYELTQAFDSCIAS